MSFYPGLVLMFFVLTPVWLKKKTKALSGDGKKAKVVRPDWRTIMIEDVEIMNRCVRACVTVVVVVVCFV